MPREDQYAELFGLRMTALWICALDWGGTLDVGCAAMARAASTRFDAGASMPREDQYAGFVGLRMTAL